MPMVTVRGRIGRGIGALLGFLALAGSGIGVAQTPQQRSPMVETTRAHPRLKDERPEGVRRPLRIGTLFIPGSLANRRERPLVMHFHGPAWLTECAAAKAGAASISIQLGAGSGRYERPFQEPAAFRDLLDEASRTADGTWSSVTLSGWSAGYGAIRAILREPVHVRRVDRIILLDGLHAGYRSADNASPKAAVRSAPTVNSSVPPTQPSPLTTRPASASKENPSSAPKASPTLSEPAVDPSDLAPFLSFARLAVAGEKRMRITHSEVFPGTFASTTECVDRLLADLQLPRQRVLEWGPMGMQRLSRTVAGKLVVEGFAGNSAPDHVDHLHALPELLRLSEP
jgi:hypothetical protein